MVATNRIRQRLTPTRARPWCMTWDCTLSASAAHSNLSVSTHGAGRSGCGDSWPTERLTRPREVYYTAGTTRLWDLKSMGPKRNSLVQRRRPVLDDRDR